MRCLLCEHGETKPGHATVTLERGESTIVFRKVPAQVCENCGEEYVAEDTSARLLAIAEEAVAAGVQVDVREYSAA